MILNNQLSIGAEVGCAQGTTTSRLLRHCPQLRLYAVDKWEQVEASAIAGASMVGGEDDGDNCVGWDPIKGFMKFHSLTTPYAARLTVLRGDSSAMAVYVPDESLDFVFIDADHRYSAVIKDLAAWVPKLKPGGMLCGHDLHLIGVRTALDEKLTHYEDSGVDNVWFCKKEDYS